MSVHEEQNRPVGFSLSPLAHDTQLTGNASSQGGLLDDVFGSSPQTGPVAPTGPHLDVMQILRFRFTIILTFLLIAAPAVAGIWMLIRPEYRTSASVRVRPIIPRFVFRTEENGIIPLYQSYLNTQSSVIRSPLVLQRVLDEPEIQKTAWYRGESDLLGRQPAPPLERLKESLKVRPRSKTEVIDVSMTTTRANDAATLVNAVLDHYLAFIREKAEHEDDGMYRKLVEEHESLRNELEGRENVLARLRKELGTATPEELMSKKRVRLDDMEARLRDLNREIMIAERQRKPLAELIEKQKDKSQATSTSQPAPQLAYQDDPEWKRLYVNVRTAQHRIDVEKGRLGDAHPRMVELNKEVELAKELLESRQDQLERQWRMGPTDPQPGSPLTEQTLVGQYEALSRKVDLLKYEHKLVQEDVGKEQAAFDRLFEKAQTLIKQTEDIQRKRELYEAVRSRLDQKTMERNVPASIEVLARAFPPTEPSQDRRMLLSFLVIMVAGGAGLGLAFLRAVTTQSISGVTDLPSTSMVPFLGRIPLVRFDDWVGASPETLAEHGEHIRMIRTALLERLDKTRGNAILISSPVPKAGKTTVSTMLGRSLAQCGLKVLLVDADLRNPTVAERFGIAQSPGLIDALTGRADPDQLIVTTNTDRFSILPAGKLTGGIELELIANGALSACLSRWRQEYDVVLIDSAPLLPVADARILARQVDASVMVVREGHCRRTEVADALEQFTASGARLLGTIYIGSAPKRSYAGSYHAYHYAPLEVASSNREEGTL